ncbi:MAG: hemolysin family protein [Eubacteriales bacterium]|nr:hemolysin family protein [Eubacteriales bacterium]MDD4541342.1 hemolysin family protein [Eubacteriales bacterium]
MDPHSTSAVLSNIYYPISLFSFNWLGALLLTIFLLLLSAMSKSFDMALLEFNRSSSFRQASEQESELPKSLKKICEDNAMEYLLRELHLLRLFFVLLYFVWTLGFFVPRLLMPSGLDTRLNVIIYVAYSLAAVFLYALLGESLPASIVRRSDSDSKARIGFLRFCLVIFKPLLLIMRPLERLINFLVELLTRLFTGKAEDDNSVMQVEEYFMMLESDEANWDEEAKDRALIRNIFRFDDICVADVMTHRTDIVALPLDASFEETLEVIKEEKYTRVPIYEDTIDKIVGVLHVKDLLPLLNDEERKREFSLVAEMRQPIFTPETRVVKDLFFEMQGKRVQLAIVIDEYGGTAGIVTMEDLIEEILGDISDEYDEEEQLLQSQSPNSWLISGWCPLEVLAEEIAQELPIDDYDTVSGFVIDLLDRIPEEGEQVEVKYDNLQFTVLSVADNRIEQLRLTIETDEENDDKQDESAEN